MTKKAETPPAKPSPTALANGGEYVPVPVAAARAIAEQYGKSIVIIFAWDDIHGLLHTTTYGTTPQDKAWAAQGGEIGTKALGGLLEAATEYEDYRQDRIKELTAALVRTRVRMLRYGEDQSEIDEIDAVLAKARGKSDAG